MGTSSDLSYLKVPKRVSASKQACSDVERPKVALTAATTEKTTQVNTKITVKAGVRIENLEQDGHNQDGALEASYHKLVILVLFLNPEGQQDHLTVYRDLQFMK